MTATADTELLAKALLRLGDDKTIRAALAGQLDDPVAMILRLAPAHLQPGGGVMSRMPKAWTAGDKAAFIVHVVLATVP